MSITLSADLLADSATAALVEKIRGAALELAALRGPFSLFALLEREDTPGRWDVVVSAPWLGTERDGIFTVAQQLTGLLSPEEMISIGRIAPLPANGDFVRFLQEVYTGMASGPMDRVWLGTSTLSGVEISRGCILAASPAPERERVVLGHT